MLALTASLLCMQAKAQLSSNADKFLGNITTSYQVDYGAEKYYTLWNQITPENETKWASIEGQRGNFNWSGADNAYNYAKQHDFPFKFHTLVWGSQYPNWMDGLSTADQYDEIVKWMDAVKAHYPDLPLIDVVNEAVAGHAPAPYRAALGGEGKTGYDWIIKAFEMAHERWPDAILIYNDYNTFQWQCEQFIELVRTLRDAGAPIDAYGCQSHDLTDMNVNDFKNAMDQIQRELQIPMYSTEYDIGTNDDAYQLQRYKEQIPYMWEADYCAGITLWGYIYGKTWTTDGNSGIIRNGQDRPAMTWLREYMQTDAAKNAKSPFPGMVKEASIYVKPTALSVTEKEPMTIDVRASMKTKTIDHIDLFVKGEKLCTMTEAPYIAEYTPAGKGKYDIKAVVVTTDGTEYTRLSGFTAFGARAPFKEELITLPGRLEIEDFDQGGEGLTFHDSDTKDEGGTNYRADNGGVDIVGTETGYGIGYTAQGEWLEYTVEVTEAGMYAVDAYGASGISGSAFTLSVDQGNGLQLMTTVNIPCVADNDWSKYGIAHSVCSVPLTVGRHVIRLTITGAYANIDYIDFSLAERKPYDGIIAIPGIIEAENFDCGGEGLTFHDSDAKNEGDANYRDDNGGLDIGQGNGGYVIGYTAQGEWTEYTVDVTVAGEYEYVATVSSGSNNSGFSLFAWADGQLTRLTNKINVPNGGNWDDYTTVTGKVLIPLQKGEQTFRLTIDAPYCNIDKVELICTSAGIEEIAADEPGNATLYNLSGQKVNADYKGFVIRNGKKFVNR